MKMMNIKAIVALVLGFQSASAFTFTVQQQQQRQSASPCILSANNMNNENDIDIDNRRTFFKKTMTILGTASVIQGGLTLPANALVKGNAPPPKKKSTEERKCTNVEECQEMAERLANQQDEEIKANAVPAKLAPKGTRYIEMISVNDDNNDIVAVKTGDVATVHYKVLKLGKRSYDGLSGEATVVFSKGYGLEDDETKPGQKAFTFTVGDSTIVAALNDALPGMKIGETRRLAVLPQMGWERPDRACDGGPGGQGAGGDLKTDYVVVPTATMVATETCFDKSKLPFPERYDQQRRMAQRFDQSLIMEVELVNVKS